MMKWDLRPLVVVAISTVCAAAGGAECQARGLNEGRPIPRVLSPFIQALPSQSPAAFVLRGTRRTVYFSPMGLKWVLGRPGRSSVVGVDFVGGCSRARIVASVPVGGTYTALDEEGKSRRLVACRRLAYREVWPGIDIVFAVDGEQLKTEFHVRPGGRVESIKLRYAGATTVGIDDAGWLRVTTSDGDIRDAAPVAYALVDGARLDVESRHRIVSAVVGGAGGDVVAGFDVGDYPSGSTLVIDPAVRIYSGFLGGVGGDDITGCAVDSSGNLYVCGTTNSGGGFPAKVGPSTTFGGRADAFVAKVDASGKFLHYCGFIGGPGVDQAADVAVDASGAVYCVGRADSGFPVVGGWSSAVSGVFVCKVNAQGNALVYSGFLGDADPTTVPSAITVDASGCAYITGSTGADERVFPVRTGPDLTHNSPPFDDAFIAKINANGTALVFCGYLGGTLRDYGADIAVDSGNRAYVTGATFSPDLPVRIGPGLTYHASSQPLRNGDAFVARIDPSGTTIEYCGYIGGDGLDSAEAIAVDGSGCAYVAGAAAADESSFPVAVGPDLTHNGGSWDAFVAKVSATGNSLVYCGYIGGEQGETAFGIDVDSDGAAYVAGDTSSRVTFPTGGGLDTTFNGVADAFVTKVDPNGSTVVFSGFIGGSGREIARAVSVDVTGHLHVVGQTQSTEATFPVSIGPDLTFNDTCSCGDGFVLRFAQIELRSVGTARPGSTLQLQLLASADLGTTYQAGTALGTGPIPVGGNRIIALSPDPLLGLSTSGLLPGVFQGYRGAIGKQGRAAAALAIPSWAFLVGQRFYSAFVTLRPGSPSGIKSISNTVSTTIVP